MSQFQCEICGLKGINNEVEIAFHLLECHEVNILTLLNNTVILTPTKIILAPRSQFWSNKRGPPLPQPILGTTTLHIKSEKDDDTTEQRSSQSLEIATDCEQSKSSNSSSSSATLPPLPSRINLNPPPPKIVPDGRWKCLVPSCGKSYKRIEHLRRHSKTHSDKPQTNMIFPCDFPACGKSFNRKETLTKHFTTHPIQNQDHEKVPLSSKSKSELKLKFPCKFPGCEESFPTNFQRSAHFRIHPKMAFFQHDKFKCDFPGCSKSFWKFQGLTGHKIMAHGGKARESVDCEFCLVSFQNEGELAEHLAKTGMKCGVTCEVCKKEFGSKIGLVRHIKSAHGTKCEVCQKPFQSEDGLNEHYEKFHHLVNVQGMKLEGEEQLEHFLEEEEIKEFKNE